MSLISVKNLTFSYDGSYDNIFEDVSFQIDTDWKLGFCGRNGRGKTTFLNLLTGKYEYSGEISASVGFEYFPYEAEDIKADSIDLIRGICPDFAQWELVRELSLLEAPEEALYRPFESLSQGERTKLLLAALFMKENSFLLIDEPTNHLDMRGRAVVSEYLRSKRGFILVSHDRAFLDNCVDHILSINRTDIELQRGNFSSWLVNRERKDSFELSENERLQKDIKRLRQAAAQSSKWADGAEKKKLGKGSADKEGDSMAYYGEKSRRMQQRRKNLEHRRQTAIEEKAGLLKNVESAENLKMPHLKYHTNRLISLEDISVFFGEKAVCKDVSFEVNQGDRIALCGRNGSGKTSLFKLILGEDIRFSGDLQLGSRLIISHVSQDTSRLKGDLSAFAREKGIDESLFKTILRKLDFSRTQFEKDMGEFSGGQKKKVLIAASLCEKAHLYIWDEPLNFIDVISRMQIEDLLLTYRPTILFVEHDSVFCDNVATKRVVLS